MIEIFLEKNAITRNSNKNYIIKFKEGNRYKTISLKNFKKTNQNKILKNLKEFAVELNKKIIEPAISNENYIINILNSRFSNSQNRRLLLFFLIISIGLILFNLFIPYYLWYLSTSDLVFGIFDSGLYYESALIITALCIHASIATIILLTRKPKYVFQISENEIKATSSKDNIFKISWAEFDKIEVTHKKYLYRNEIYLRKLIMFISGSNYQELVINYRELIIDNFKERTQSKILRNLRDYALILNKEFIESNLVYDSKNFKKANLTKSEITHIKNKELIEKLDKTEDIFILKSILSLIFISILITILFIIFRVDSIYVIIISAIMLFIFVLATNINIDKTHDKIKWIRANPKDSEINNKKISYYKKIEKSKRKEEFKEVFKKSKHKDMIIIKDSFIFRWFLTYFIMIILFPFAPLFYFLGFTYLAILIYFGGIFLAALLAICINYIWGRKSIFTISDNEICCFIPRLEYFSIKWEEIKKIILQEIYYPKRKYKGSRHSWSGSKMYFSMKNPILIYNFEIIYKNTNFNFYFDKEKFHKNKIKKIVQNLEEFAHIKKKLFIIKDEDKHYKENDDYYEIKRSNGVERYRTYKKLIK